MALLAEIANRLIASTQGIGGLPGTTAVTDTGWTIYQSIMPATTAPSIAILETGGFAPLWKTALNFPTFQVQVKAARLDYGTGRAKLAAIQTELHGIGNRILTESGSTDGQWYVGIQAEGDALSLGYDNNDRPTLAQNYLALRSRTT